MARCLPLLVALCVSLGVGPHALAGAAPDDGGPVWHVLVIETDRDHVSVWLTLVEANDAAVRASIYRPDGTRGSSATVWLSSAAVAYAHVEGPAGDVDVRHDERGDNMRPTTAAGILLNPDGWGNSSGIFRFALYAGGDVGETRLTVELGGDARVLEHRQGREVFHVTASELQGGIGAGAGRWNVAGGGAHAGALNTYAFDVEQDFVASSWPVSILDRGVERIALHGPSGSHECPCRFDGRELTPGTYTLTRTGAHAQPFEAEVPLLFGADLDLW